MVVPEVCGFSNLLVISRVGGKVNETVGNNFLDIIFFFLSYCFVWLLISSPINELCWKEILVSEEATS